MKRMMTRARGSGSRILKRSSHIRIILSDEIEIKTRDKKKAGAKKGGAKKRSGGAKAAKSQSKPQQTETTPAAATEATAPDPNLTSRTDVNE